jgi:hypothetical protein
MTFKVGDVVILIWVYQPANSSRIGSEYVIDGDLQAFPWGIGHYAIRPDGTRTTVDPKQVRLKRPPTEDFTPAETEFTDWLRKQVRVVS